MNNNTLNNSTLLFFLLLMAAVLVSLFGSSKYGTGNQRVATILEEAEPFHYGMLHARLADGEQPEGFLLIDLRDREHFTRGHIEGAVNVPFSELTHRNHRKTWRQNQDLLLYADSERIAVAAQAVLLGKGVRNVFVVPGGYDDIRNYATDHFEPSRAFYGEDKARWDYQRFMPVGTKTKQRDSREPSPAVPDGEQPEPVAGGC